MQRLNGRQALSVFAEVECGKRQLNERETKYLEQQVDSFTQWLTKQGLNELEAKERVREMIEQDIQLLMEDDPYADFIWSRGQEVGELEINPAEANNDFESTSDADHQSAQNYWDRMEMIADKNVGKYPDEVWAASKEKMEQIFDALNKIKHSGVLPEGKVRQRLFKMNKRINDLRFGKKPVLLNRHWKMAKNLINELLGNSKRYEVKEKEEKSEEEKIDAMDMAVFGVLDNYEIYK